MRIGNKFKQEAKIDVLYEDEFVLVVDKPAGLIIDQSEERNSSNTMLFRVNDYLRARSEKRAYLCHRLDKDTSGCVIFAKTKDIEKKIFDLFKKGEVIKTYLVVIIGALARREGTLSFPLKKIGIGREKVIVDKKHGMKAITQYKLKTIIRLDKKLPPLSLVKVRLVTGRTHQIRVHFACLRQPVLFDKQYGDQAMNKKFSSFFPKGKQMLNAWKINFIHPVTGDKIKCKSKYEFKI